MILSQKNDLFPLGAIPPCLFVSRWSRLLSLPSLALCMNTRPGKASVRVWVRRLRGSVHVMRGGSARASGCGCSKWRPRRADADAVAASANLYMWLCHIISIHFMDGNFTIRNGRHVLINRSAYQIDTAFFRHLRKWCINYTYCWGVVLRNKERLF